MLGCEKSEICMKDAAISGFVELSRFPLATLLASGFSSTQAVELIESLLPAGVKINGDNFEGTFTFSGEELEADDEHGFSDLTQSMGGYLGLILGDDEHIIGLPIE